MMTAQNGLAQEEGELFVLSCFPNLFWKQLGYSPKEFNPGIMVLGIHRHLNFSYVLPSKGVSLRPNDGDESGTVLCVMCRGPLWCDTSDTATQGCCTGHFPPSPHEQIPSLPSLVEVIIPLQL